MSGLNKVAVNLYLSGMSLPEVARTVSAGVSTVRYHVKKSGALRTRAEGVRLAADKGLLGSGNRGKSLVFSEEHKKNISESKLKWGEKYARGFSDKASGYCEITRGVHKGRCVHRVLMEKEVGRRLKGDEVVHHLDGNPSNNKIENLCVMNVSDHLRLHRKQDNHKKERGKNGQFLPSKEALCQD